MVKIPNLVIVEIELSTLNKSAMRGAQFEHICMPAINSYFQVNLFLNLPVRLFKTLPVKVSSN